MASFHTLSYSHPVPCASRRAAGAESERLCLGTAFGTTDKPSSSSQSASPPHSPFFPVSPRRYRCRRCRQPPDHAGKEGHHGTVIAVQRGAQRLPMCLLHRITLSLRGTKRNSKELHATVAARLCSTDFSTAFLETSKPQLSS